MAYFKEIKFSDFEWKVFWGLMFIVLLGKFAIFLPVSYSMDDYSDLYGVDTVSVSFVRMERFSSALVHMLLYKLGIYPAASDVVLGLFSICCIIFCGIILSRL